MSFFLFLDLITKKKKEKKLPTLIWNNTFKCVSSVFDNDRRHFVAATSAVTGTIQFMWSVWIC